MKPVKTFKSGNVQGSIFFHTNTNRQSGQKFSSHSVHMHRRYEESPGVWKSTSYFRFFELPQVALVLQLCTAYVAEQEAEVVMDQVPASQEAEQSGENEEARPDNSHSHGAPATAKATA